MGRPKAKRKRPRSRNGEPAIEEYRPGRYRVTVDLGKRSDGTRNRVVRTSADYEEIVRLRLELLTQRARGALSGSRTTLGTWIEQYLETAIRPPKRAHRTYRTYLSWYECHIKPTIGHIPLGRLAPGDVRRCLESAEQTASATTANGVRAVLTGALRAAEEREYVYRNVARVIPTLSVQASAQRSYTLEEALRLLRAIADDPYESLYLIGLCTGLRHSEALGLTWPSVQWATGELHVTHQLQRVTGEGLQLLRLKTDASASAEVMPTILVDSLRRHQARQTIVHPWRLVFTRPDGRPMDYQYSNARWHELIARHQLPPIRYHDLRHTCGSLLHAAGIDLKTIQAVLRHADYQTTANIYVHTNQAAKRRAAETMDRLLRKAVE